MLLLPFPALNHQPPLSTLTVVICGPERHERELSFVLTPGIENLKYTHVKTATLRVTCQKMSLQILPLHTEREKIIVYSKVLHVESNCIVQFKNTFLPTKRDTQLCNTSMRKYIKIISNIGGKFMRKTFWTVVIQNVFHGTGGEGGSKLSQNIALVKLHQQNQKHLYPELNGYGHNSERSLKEELLPFIDYHIHIKSRESSLFM
jgi:hypothetical protein